LQGKFADALELISALLTELKKLDDKQLLVETHLTEAKVRMIGGWGNQTPYPPLSCTLTQTPLSPLKPRRSTTASPTSPRPRPP
jgi:hypothetical protein